MTTEKQLQNEIESEKNAMNSINYNDKEASQTNYQFVMEVDYENEVFEIGFDKGLITGLKKAQNILETTFTQKEVYLTIYSFLLTLGAIFAGLYYFFTYLETTI